MKRPGDGASGTLTFRHTSHKEDQESGVEGWQGKVLIQREVFEDRAGIVTQGVLFQHPHFTLLCIGAPLTGIQDKAEATVCLVHSCVLLLHTERGTQWIFNEWMNEHWLCRSGHWVLRKLAVTQWNAGSELRYQLCRAAWIASPVSVVQPTSVQAKGFFSGSSVASSDSCGPKPYTWLQIALQI